MGWVDKGPLLIGDHHGSTEMVRLPTCLTSSPVRGPAPGLARAQRERSVAMRIASDTTASSSSSAFIRFTILPSLKSSPTPLCP